MKRGEDYLRPISVPVCISLTYKATGEAFREKKKITLTERGRIRENHYFSMSLMPVNSSEFFVLIYKHMCKNISIRILHQDLFGIRLKALVLPALLGQLCLAWICFSEPGFLYCPADFYAQLSNV